MKVKLIPASKAASIKKSNANNSNIYLQYAIIDINSKLIPAFCIGFNNINIFIKNEWFTTDLKNLLKESGYSIKEHKIPPGEDKYINISWTY